MDVKEFKQLPLMGILRGIEPGDVTPLTETVISSGLKTIEVTMNTEGAAELIRKMRKVAGARLTIGAGTVITLDNLKQAQDAGATFIVLPSLIEEVVSYCLKHSMPVFPGALTPHEIYQAWLAGATMVKVFPAKVFGPGYLKEIKAPFQDIELLACGGVNKDTIGDYFKAGASAVAFGASVFKKEWLKSNNFSDIEVSIRTLISGYREHS